MGILYFLIAILVLVAVIISKSLTIIPQSETKVIERLGRYNRTLESGVNLIIPFIDAPREIYSRYQYERSRFTMEGMDAGRDFVVKRSTKIDLREQVYDFPRQSVITKDNVPTTINALLYFQITDPVKAVYEIDNLPNAIEKLTQTTLRNIIGSMELDETLTSRDTINTKLRAVLDEATDKWGVKVNRVELQDIMPGEDVMEAMAKQMNAERERRASVLAAQGAKESAILRSEGEKMALINQAEAEKQAEILAAEGKAQAQILQAQADAEAIQKVAQALAGDKDVTPSNYILAEKYIATLKSMAEGQDSKTVYLPYDASAIMSSVACMKDMFNK